MNIWLQNNFFFAIPAYQWLVAIVIALVCYFAMRIIWRLILKKMTEIALKTASILDDVFVEVLNSTQKLTLAIFALLIGMHFLELPSKWESRLDHISFIIIGIQFALWLSKGITIWSRLQLTEKNGPVPNHVITSMLSWVFKAVIWSIIFLTILANVGVNITAFVASLGVGGVAVALAVQSILSDLFASLAIGLDKPFIIGDFVVFGEVAGSIERVGLKTTHIRSISGEQIVCSNTELLKNTIHNYKRMSERRVVFNFGITYDTQPAMLEKIPLLVKKAVALSKDTRFDRAHFKEFGANALNFEVVYFITSSDFNLYMDIQQSINLYLMNEFKNMEVKFALPAVTLNASNLDVMVKAPHS
jgi:small-conductance mechanosensitive channel